MSTAEILYGLGGIVLGYVLKAAVAKVRILLDQQISLAGEFVQKAYQYLGDHVSPAGHFARNGNGEEDDDEGDAERDLGKERQELVLLSEQVALILPTYLAVEVDEWTNDYVDAVQLVIDGEANRDDYDTLKEELD